MKTRPQRIFKDADILAAGHHYTNTPIQLPAIFTAVKIDDLQMKDCDNFLI